MKGLKKTVWGFLNLFGIGGAIQLLLQGYLIDKGWYSSFSKKAAVDSEMNPIPWLTYPFIFFLDRRIKKDWKIFEYGAGSSTLWFMKRVEKVHSVEHDINWFNKLKSQVQENCKITFQVDSINGEFAKEILKSDIKYDLVLVDANDRYHCSLYATQALSSRGVIVLDNAERVEYNPIYEMLINKGFKFIEFEGLSPSTHSTNITTIFYKNENCLGI